MAFEKLKRTNYDHSGPHTARDHHQDFDEYHQPLNRMQNSNLFDWGIAKGLNVTGSIGTKQLQVNPGVGIDAGGRLISLASGGQADIGANPIGMPSQNQLVPVPVTLTSSGFHGKTVYVTIQFSLFYSKSPTDPFDPGDYEQIPWVRLQDTTLFVNDGNALALAKATIDATGNITSIDGTARKLVGTSIGKLTLRKGNPATSSGAFDIKEDVTIEADGDTASLNIGSKGNDGNLMVKDGAGKVVLKFDGKEASLRIGNQNNEGDLIIRDGNNRVVLGFNSANATLHLGHNIGGNAGDFIVRDNAGNESAKIDGNTGKLNIKRIEPYGNALDIDARYVRIHGWDLMLDGRSGGNKRALVDLGNKLIINYNGDYRDGVDVASKLRTKVDGIYRTLGGNLTRYVRYRSLFVSQNNRYVTQDIDLGSSRRFLAFTSIVGMDPLGDFDKYDAYSAEVYKIDGNNTNKWIHGGRHFGSSGSNNNFHTPIDSGTGRVITFRARTFNNAELMAIGVVFYE